LRQSPWLTGFAGVNGEIVFDLENALRIHFQAAVDDAWADFDLLERLSGRLLDARKLQARNVAALCREHGRRARVEAATVLAQDGLMRSPRLTACR